MGQLVPTVAADTRQVTDLLLQISHGDTAAMDRLIPLVEEDR